MILKESIPKEKDLRNTFWAEGVHIDVYILDGSPTQVVKDKTRIEAWSGKRPKGKHLRVFGSISYIHVRK